LLRYFSWYHSIERKHNLPYVYFEWCFSCHSQAIACSIKRGTFPRGWSHMAGFDQSYRHCLKILRSLVFSTEDCWDI
jgi:hypothetical protein